MVTHPASSIVGARPAEVPHEGLYALGRVMLASIFILSGYGKIAGLEGFASMLGNRYGLPAPYALTVIGVVVELLGAIAIIVGFKMRWAALALIIFTIIATYLAHRYWTYPPEQVMNQYNHFLKNIAIIGGLLILMGVGPGRWTVERWWIPNG